jgi:hypothetical protein
MYMATKTQVALGLGDDWELIQSPKWTPYDAVAVCGGFEGMEHDQETLISAWQFLIDIGMTWTLQDRLEEK